MPSSDPKEIKDLIDVVLKRCNFNETISRGQVETAYNQVVSDIIRKFTWELRYDTKTHILYVKLASPALKHELTYKATDLINAINSKLPSAIVQKVVFL